MTFVFQSRIEPVGITDFLCEHIKKLLSDKFEDVESYIDEVEVGSFAVTVYLNIGEMDSNLAESEIKSILSSQLTLRGESLFMSRSIIRNRRECSKRSMDFSGSIRPN